jgi:hypothetical protein
MKLIKFSRKSEQLTCKSGRATSQLSRLPLHFNVFFKCLRGIPVEDEDEAELNDRIRMWIQESTLQGDLPTRMAEFPADYQSIDAQVAETGKQPMQQKEAVHVQSPTRNVSIEDTPEPMNIVETVVAIVIAPLNFPSESLERNPVGEIQSKLANFVPETIDHLRIHTNKLFASFEVQKS